VTAAITAIESNAPMTVASGYEESGIETEGALTGMRLGNSSRIETSAMTPKTIAGIAATQIRVTGHEARASFLRASRVAAGGPQPEK
jgi:hypothetical protein